MKELLVLGGGAAGLLAAQTAAMRGFRVTLLEAGDRVGKKLLATGNGRCNLSNLSAVPSVYSSPEANGFLLPPEELLELFFALGLSVRADEEGRVYPKSNQASSVLDVLRMGAERSGVACLCGFEAVSVRKTKGGFHVKAADGREAAGDRLLLCSGGKASSKVNGYSLVQSLGHSITPLRPALTYLKTDPQLLKGLQGQRVQCRIRLLRGEICLAEEAGELLFKDKALSGIAVFDLSRVYARAQGSCVLSVNLLPEWTCQQVTKELWRREKLFTSADTLFTGLFSRLLAQRLLECADIPIKGGAPDGKGIARLSSLLQDWRFSVLGSGGFDQAQLCVGGVPLQEVEKGNLRSRCCENLYLAGELLDLDGPCGGFNLHQAFSTGYLAAKNMD